MKFYLIGVALSFLYYIFQYKNDIKEIGSKTKYWLVMISVLSLSWIGFIVGIVTDILENREMIKELEEKIKEP